MNNQIIDTDNIYEAFRELSTAFADVRKAQALAEVKEIERLREAAPSSYHSRN